MSSSLAVLVVIAHPDDETLFAGFIHALAHKVHAVVDLVCVTNGEGGFRHSAIAEYFYDSLQLSKETIARQHLPRIRQHELLASGKVLGVRKFFFLDQLDWKYDRNVDVVFAEQWDKEEVIQRLQRTIKTGNGTDGYDLMLVMLPSVDAHGHHTASGLTALEAVQRLREQNLPNVKIPTVLGGSEFLSTDTPTYASNRLAEISSVVPNEFQFNRAWKLSKTTDVPDYQTVVLWSCSAHKSQGALITETLSAYARNFEQYFYFALNEEPTRLPIVQKLFEDLAEIHQ